MRGAGAAKGGRLGALQADSQGGGIAWATTLLRGRPRRRLDLVRQPRSRRPVELWLVIVDHSASTRRYGALAQAKQVLLDWFEQAYRARARVAVLQAAGQGPRWRLQGERSGAALRLWVEGLGAGGGTPLVASLAEAQRWLERRRRKHPGEDCRLLLVTDGRIRDWEGLQAPACPALLLDIESGALRLGRARLLAQHLGAQYLHLDELPHS